MEDSDDDEEEAFLLDLLSGAALPEDPEGGVASTSWTPVEGFDTIIKIDDVICNIIRYDGKTCFELFHEIEEINNPCDSSRSPARVKRAAHNRSLPPSRRRNIVDDQND
jgi:hypothetical protein